MPDLNASVYIAGLLSEFDPPCMSIYMPTHRHHPDNQKDLILFRNLVKDLERSLRREYPAREAKPLLEPFEALAGDRAFWNNTLDGLAIFAAPGFFRVLRLQSPVVELAVVARSFHVKPLLRIYQSADRYQVLCINRNEIKLYEGNRYALDEIEPAPEVPRTRAQGIGESRSEPHLTVASYGKGVEGPAMYHGHGSRKDEVGKETERFFRIIDGAVMEHHSLPSGLPLILAALPEHQGMFRKISKNPLLLEAGIERDPYALSPEEFRELAWKVYEPRYNAEMEGYIEEFRKARTAGLTAEDLGSVARSAVASGIATLLVEADRHIPGRLDEKTGRIGRASLEHPEVDDLLDDLSELVLKRGGRVIVTPGELMPTKTGVAAIRRF
ncbi:MAG: hypothetical protein H5T74_00530 [Actinobacteria bacterium]|nr:hypothetical protein [Actinomycetota bacterium]